MKKYYQILSAVLSIVLTGTVICASAYAEDNSMANYNTITTESKELSQDISSANSSAPLDVLDIYNAHMAAQTVEPPVDDSIYRESWGIDVSRYQGNIDWFAVKASGVDFAIINAGYGKEAYQEDPCFRKNVEGAQAAGIDCGAYWYSYATTVEEAYQEAETCYQVIKDYDFTFPIYFDVEEPFLFNMTTAQVSAIVDAFCTRLEEKGCYVGVYSCASILTSRVYESVLDKYAVWVAHYTEGHPDFYGNYGMWQYTSNGLDQVNGITGSGLDLNHCYINYPYLIKGSSTQIPEPPQVTPPNDTDPNITAKGITVSEWQGNINWQNVAASGVDYAVIRAGYGQYASQKDRYFDKNYYEAKAAGLGVGAYWYSYAKTPEEALREAEVFCDIIDGYQYEYPLYFDIEDAALYGLTTQEVTAIIDAFCSYVESKGYYIGVMSTTSFMNSSFDASIYQKYAVCILQTGCSKPDFSRFFGMWQYSHTGCINGVKGEVALSYCYDEYPGIMKRVHLNGF